MKEELCLEFRNVSFSYPDEPNKMILNNISFKINKGDIISVLGPNGSGKTTLINLLSGFITPTAGEVIFHNKLENEIFSSTVFQDNSLLDWKAAFENIELSLISNIDDEKEIEQIVNKMLRLLKIDEYKEKLPKQLSGGTKQRVVIARALAPDPKLLLLDEPFSSLDLMSKEELMKDLRKIIFEKGKSAVFVTHSIDEALFLSDLILVLDNKSNTISKILENPLPSERTFEMLWQPDIFRFKEDLKELIFNPNK